MAPCHWTSLRTLVFEAENWSIPQCLLYSLSNATRVSPVKSAPLPLGKEARRQVTFFHLNHTVVPHTALHLAFWAQKPRCNEVMAEQQADRGEEMPST